MDITTVALALAQTLRWRAFSYPSDFDSPHTRHGTSCGDGECLIKRCDVDEQVATELLARFRKRTVGHELFAVAHLDPGCRRRRVQGGTGEILPARRQLVCKLQLLLVDLLSCGEA